MTIYSTSVNRYLVLEIILKNKSKKLNIADYSNSLPHNPYILTSEYFNKRSLNSIISNFYTGSLHTVVNY